jgi:hypothetical protein
MSITLSVDLTTIELPPDLHWSDEAWSPVVQSADHGLDGALIVQSAARLAGRPITLAPFNGEGAWMPRATVDQLLAWQAMAGLQLTLTMRSVARSVMFRHQDGQAVELSPLWHFSDDPDPDDLYVATLRFMEL